MLSKEAPLCSVADNLKTIILPRHARDKYRESTRKTSNFIYKWLADNGGPLGSANNYPLKGGKHSNWQGGVR